MASFLPLLNCYSLITLPFLMVLHQAGTVKLHCFRDRKKSLEILFYKVKIQVVKKSIDITVLFSFPFPSPFPFPF